MGELVLLDDVGRMNRRRLATTPSEDVIQALMLRHNPRQVLVLIRLEVREVGQADGYHPLTLSRREDFRGW